MSRVAVSGFIAGAAGVGTVLLNVACSPTISAYNQCRNQAVGYLKAPPAFMVFEYLTNAITFDGSKQCPREYTAYNTCDFLHRSLVCIAITAGIICLHSACQRPRGT